MTLFIAILLSLFSSGQLVADSDAENGKIIKIQQLSKEADLSSLTKDYSVSSTDKLAPKKSALISVQERDAYFKKANLLESMTKYDQLDRDIIFHTIKKNGVAACLKKYPELEEKRPQLLTLYHLLRK